MDFSLARQNMVDNQIRTNGVTDARLLEALGAVPREAFVPESLRGIAYLDDEIDLGGGRRMLEPMVFARLLQFAEIQSDEIVLDIGCASGYSAAVLARLAGTVVAMESDKTLARRATTLLTELGCDNVAVVEAALADGHRAHGPYNVIMIEGGVASIGDNLLAQLADRGRLLAVSYRAGAVGQATLTLRVGGSFSARSLFDASARVLPGFEARQRFTF